MYKAYFRLEEAIIQRYLQGRRLLSATLFNDRGDVTTVGILGWAAVVVTLIVAVHGLLTGWLPNFIEDKIFDRANQL